MARQLKTYGYKPRKGLGRMNQGQIEPVDLPNQRDTRSLRYKKRQGKDKRASRKIERPIPHIRETFPHPAETMFPDQVSQPSLTINWTSVVPTGSIRDLFEENVAMITGAGAAVKPTVRRLEPGETLNNWEIRPLLCKRAFG